VTLSVTAPAAREGSKTGLFGRLVAAWERRRAFAELARLDDRLLADIGMSRGTIMDRLIRAEAVHPTGQRDVGLLLEAVRTRPVAANQDAAVRRAA
jgi:uncharacterized protein YjiS (DUF1127 family)